MIAQVLLPLPTDTAFDFSVPERLSSALRVGQRVRVRFRGKERLGILLCLAQETEHRGALEDVLGVHEGPAFSEEALAFGTHVAEQYLAPLGVALNRALPARTSRDRDRLFVVGLSLGEISERLGALAKRAPRQAAVLRLFLSLPGPVSMRKMRDALGAVGAPLARLVQAGLVREVGAKGGISPQIPLPFPDFEKEWTDRFDRSSRVLLFARDRWSTYAALVQQALSLSRRALVLAPEILLARELALYLRKNVGCEVELYHSTLSPREQGDAWERARRGEARVVVGTRSALFLPLADLGLLIVDEEQDRSYKQEEMVPHYHARSVAPARAGKGLVVLGSGAPSLESFRAGQQGSFELVRPREEGRVQEIRAIDLRKERGPLSVPLLASIERALVARRQVIVGVCRLGYFQAVLCKECGRSLGCPTCGVNLTYRPARGQLACHICGRTYTGLGCAQCGSRSLRFVGLGAERVEEEMHLRFPEARVARIDVDALRTSGEERAIERALAGEVDILVATAMLAKGPALPRVGLVAAVGVDGLLALPDFRAAEWTYQYLVGLAGRVSDGEAVVETHYPDHYAIEAAAVRDYDRFYARESAERRALSYPPFAHLARVVGPSEDDPTGKRVREVASSFGVEALGPATLPARPGFQAFVLRGGDEQRLREACIALRKEIARAEIDLDPVRL